MRGRIMALVHIHIRGGAPCTGSHPGFTLISLWPLEGTGDGGEDERR